MGGGECKAEEMRDDAVGVTGRMTIRKEVWRLERGKRSTIERFSF